MFIFAQQCALLQDTKHHGVSLCPHFDCMVRYGFKFVCSSGNIFQNTYFFL
jgi:hypothetical protein